MTQDLLNETRKAAGLPVDVNPGTVRVETRHGPVVLKKPDRRQRNRYFSLVAEKQLGEAADFLCLACVVEPSRETLDGWLDDDVGLAINLLIPPLLKLAGLAERTDSKE